MNIPIKPPELPKLMAQLNPEKMQQVFLSKIGMAPDGKYRHWDTFRHLESNDGLTPDERWIAVKVARMQSYQPLPLKDSDGRYFQYALPSPALEMLHHVDRDASGTIQIGEPVINPQSRDTYLVKSLVEEAITSSQLEGASTTRRVAKEMIKTGREPRDRSERMILNNYNAMLFVHEKSDEELTPSIVLELQRILTTGTLDEPEAAGRMRRTDEAIHVSDELGNVLHTPPNARELAERLQRMCAFANARKSEPFIHPVVRAITLHFWLAYDHPFVDGNGRTARALFYWAMARQGYWLCEYISVSRILKKARGKYARAFLYSETDDNDLTYFVLYQLSVVLRAIHDLHEYLTKKTAELRETESLLGSASQSRLNYRQLALVNHALKNPNATYSVESHRHSHNVSYETARSDLLDLVSRGIVELSKRGRAFSFSPSVDLKTRLSGVKKTERRFGTITEVKRRRA